MSYLESSSFPDAQNIKNEEKHIKINGKYWSSNIQWRNLLLLTP